MPRTRRRFTAEFKTEAVKLLEESGRPLQAVAEELGIHANQLRTWRNEHLAAGSAEALARQNPTSDASRPTSPHPGSWFPAGALPRRPGMLRFTPDSAWALLPLEVCGRSAVDVHCLLSA
jgi:hypothetical protein